MWGLLVFSCWVSGFLFFFYIGLMTASLQFCGVLVFYQDPLNNCRTYFKVSGPRRCIILGCIQSGPPASFPFILWRTIIKSRMLNSAVYSLLGWRFLGSSFSWLVFHGCLVDTYWCFVEVYEGICFFYLSVNRLQTIALLFFLVVSLSRFFITCHIILLSWLDEVFPDVLLFLIDWFLHFFIHFFAVFVFVPCQIEFIS